MNFEVSEKKVKTVCNDRDFKGRFKQKYKAGEKNLAGCILKDVNENDWKEVKKDEKGNRYYKCLKCNKEGTRKDNRNKHKCRP